MQSITAIRRVFIELKCLKEQTKRISLKAQLKQVLTGFIMSYIQNNVFFLQREQNIVYEINVNPASKLGG